MPHSTGTPTTTTPDVPVQPLPPFPSHLPQAPIQRVSLEGLLRRDPAAEGALWDACRHQGFFYLDLNGTTCELGRSLAAAADALEALAHHAFRLPADAKQAAAMARCRSLFGYKGPGNVAKEDPYGRRDVGEFWNLSKDDLLGQSEHPVPYPALLQEARPLLAAFARDAHAVGLAVLAVLARRLGIPEERLASKHRLAGQSGDHVRLTYGPGEADRAGTEAEAETRITTFAHTDFGSVTLLFNWLGGLQIEVEEGEEGEGGEGKEWVWVKPLPGHAVCNLGDAMREFAGGRVASGRHRVVAAPGAQAGLDRYSVVYFVRPEDDVVLEDLTPGAGARNSGEGEGEEERWTARRWIEERSRAMGNTIKRTD